MIIFVEFRHDRFFDGFGRDAYHHQISVSWSGRRWLWSDKDNDWRVTYSEEYTKSATKALVAFMEKHLGE